MFRACTRCVSGDARRLSGDAWRVSAREVFAAAASCSHCAFATGTLAIAGWLGGILIAEWEVARLSEI
jgi:hypothetical protein